MTTRSRGLPRRPCYTYSGDANLNDVVDADAVRVAVKLEPDNAKGRVRLAHYLAESGALAEAARAVREIDDQNLDLRNLPPAVRQRLDAIRKQIGVSLR